MGDKKTGTSTTDWLYLLFWIVLPLVYVPTLVDYTLIPRQLFTAVFLLVVLLFSRKFLFRSAGLHTATASFLGFIIISVIASFSALNPVESMATLARYGLVLGFLLVTISLLKEKRLGLYVFIKGVVLFSGIASSFTLIKIIQAVANGDFFENIYTVKATFSHKNLLSAVLMMSVPFTMMGAALFRGMWRSGSLTVLFLLVAEIFILRTRGVWLASFLAFFSSGLVFFILRKRNIEGVRFPAKQVGIALGIAFILMAGLFSASQVKERFTDTSNVRKRTEFWSNSLEMIRDYPVLGVGAGNWKIHFPKYGLEGLDRSVQQGITHIQRPHSDYLWVWTEGGIAALLGYLGIFFFAFWQIGKNFRKMSSKEEFVINITAVFGLVAYLSFSVGDFPLERISTNVLAMSLIALTMYRQEPFLKLKPVHLKVLTLIMAGFGLIICIYRWQGEKGSVKVLQANSTRNAQMLISGSEEAENTFYNMDNFANPIRYYSSLGKMMLRNMPGSMEDIQTAMDIHPYNIVVLNQMGNVLKNTNKPDEALVYYKKATEIAPTFEIALLNTAEIYVKKGDYINAMEALIYIPRESQNPKFVYLMKLTLPGLLQVPAEQKKFRGLREYLQSRNVRNPDEYLFHFKEFFRRNSN